MSGINAPQNTESSWWRLWATRHRVAAAVLAGLVATQLATIAGFWFPGIGLSKLDWNTANGFVYVPYASPLERFLVGGGFHYFDGIVFAVLFACALRPLLRWRDTVLGNLAKGLTMGTLLAVISVVFMTPRVFGPALGLNAGFLSLHLGWKYVISVFVWHWVYGAHLGVVYNPLPASAAKEAAETVQTDNGADDPVALPAL